MSRSSTALDVMRSSLLNAQHPLPNEFLLYTPPGAIHGKRAAPGGAFSSGTCRPFQLLRNAPSGGHRTLCLLPEAFIIERPGRLPGLKQRDCPGMPGVEGLMQYRNDKQGQPLSILGYGCMRFTRKGAGIDLDKAEQEVLATIHNGVNYFDTAYIYPGSEAALGEILARNHCRDQVNIATKLPQYLVRGAGDLERYFTEELRRLRTDHVDFYLMHMLTDVES